MRKLKSKKDKPKKLPLAEREQVSIRRKIGAPLGVDEEGRDRVPKGTADAARRYDRSSGGIIRLRMSDPLRSISGLSARQRNAGLRYRDAYEIVARTGIKPASMAERVDSSGMNTDVPAMIIDAMGEVRTADRAMGHHEIVGVVRQVCGERRSIREIAEITKDPRPALTKLLQIGLDSLADHYFGRVKFT